MVTNPKSSENKRNTSTIWLLMVLGVLLLFLTTGLLAVRLQAMTGTKQTGSIGTGDTGTITIDNTVIRPSQYIGVHDTDENAWILTTKTIDLFQSSYRNGNDEVTAKSRDDEKVIAPGTSGTYSFSVKNERNTGLEYKMWLEKAFQMTTDSGESVDLPVQVRLSSGSAETRTWLLGSSETVWVDASTLKDIESDEAIAAGDLQDAVTGTLGANDAVSYTLEWQWPYETDANDTLLGNSTNTEFTLKLVLVAEADDTITPAPEEEPKHELPDGNDENDNKQNDPSTEPNDTETNDTETDDTETGDAGTDDARTNDVGTDDAGTDDAGTNDVGTDDAGTDDAGTGDAGTNDAGIGDTGTDDAGTNEAGTDDDGTDDAGTDDAGTGDAGTNDTGTNDIATGNDGTDEPQIIIEESTEVQIPDFDLGGEQSDIVDEKSDVVAYKQPFPWWLFILSAGILFLLWLLLVWRRRITFSGYVQTTAGTPVNGCTLRLTSGRQHDKECELEGEGYFEFKSVTLGGHKLILEDAEGRELACDKIRFRKNNRDADILALANENDEIRAVMEKKIVGIEVYLHQNHSTPGHLYIENDRWKARNRKRDVFTPEDTKASKK
jgi:hypothetical protein